jgi:uncharacterized protein (TIGR02246 family)
MHLSARRSFCVLTTALALIASGGGARASTEDEVRAAFDRFVQVQNAHDAKALETLLADSPQLLWITRGVVVWGRDAALQRFAKLYEGTWRLEPEAASIRVVPLATDVAQLHAVVHFTTGAPGQPTQTSRTLFNQVLVKSGTGWRVMSILPIPAPVQ